MEKFIEQISTKDPSDHILALDSDLELPEPFPVPVLKSLLKGIKKCLSRTSGESLLKMIDFLSKLFKVEQILPYFPVLFPALLRTIPKFPTVPMVLFLSKTMSLLASPSEIFRLLLENGLHNTSPMIQLASLSILHETSGKLKIPEEIISEIANLSKSPNDSIRTSAILIVKKHGKSDFHFNCIPSTIIDTISQSTNWKEKYSALLILEDFLHSLDSFASLDLKSFLEFLCKVLEDQNFKVCIICINLIGSVLDDKETQSRDAIFQVLPMCINKLGDNKIAVRLSAHKLFRQFVEKSADLVVPELLKALEDPNWHIREEVIMVLIAVMLLKTSKFDYFLLTPHFAKLLDDQRTKIRMASTEALAVLVNLCGSSKVTQSLEEIVDSVAFQAISKRFQQKTLPIVTDEYVTFPKDQPNTCRIISSPYISLTHFETTSQDRFRTSMSFEKIRRDTPTSAETSTEPITLRRNLIIPKLIKNSTVSSRSAHFIRKESVGCESSSVDQASYTPFEQLEQANFTQESLQRCIFHSENWLEQFETVNFIRKLVKHNPEVFLSKVTMHNIVLNLVMWADSLRSSLSKNAMIALKEMCEHIGKGIDGEIPDILKIFLKKAADTNAFLSEIAANGLNALCANCTEARLLVHLMGIAENARSPHVKDKIMHCLSKVIQKSKSGLLQMKEANKAVEFISEYMADASPEVRKTAKIAFDLLVESISDENQLSILMVLGVKENVIRKIRDAVKKKWVKVPISLSKKESFLGSTSVTSLSKREEKVKLPSLGRSKTKATFLTARVVQSELFEEEDSKKIEALEAGIMNMDWKTRYDAISNTINLIKNHHEHFAESKKLSNLVQIMQKGLNDPNLKVLIHSLTYLVKLIPLLGKKIESFLGFLMEPLVVSLGSSNTSIRDVTWDVCILLTLHTNNDILITQFAGFIGKTSPRGKAAVITLLVNIVNSIKDLQLLSNCALPVALKYIDNSRIDIRTESARLLTSLFKLLGNQVLDLAPTGKLQKVINLISKGLD